ncbi:serine/threonine protein phosphatase [Rhizobium sp. KAs_5_22]|uniref:metallophosphoesterase family protein n=1 Tax=Ciceribacter selenitireducens TaxID=448181 RepID=UPI0004BC1ED5|nr:metallophosphoesterase family protein [Ciceribacter selenitireducens]PPJ49376.1 serine/threonine protein phosphatase [Rhizobium sp. KAs_5_22]
MRALLRKLFRNGQTAAIEGRSRLSFEREAEFSAVYAIGDVHGCRTALLDAEARIVRDAAALGGKKLIVMLGDYIDRGPNSRQVLEHLIEPPPAGFERISLCGNHDELFLRFLADPAAHVSWLQLGGHATLFSYGIDASHILDRPRGLERLAELARQTVPSDQVDYLKSLPCLLTIGRIAFVHAGLRPGLPLEEQSDEDLMWIREPFLSRGPELPLVVVHGHTPAPQVTYGRGRICIDTGAFATGHLAVLKIAGGKIEEL